MNAELGLGKSALLIERAKRDGIEIKEIKLPASYSEIQTILQSKDFDASDKWVVRWQFGLLDLDFEKPLAEAIVAADEDNLQRLWLGFPTQVTGIRRWRSGDLGQRLRDAGLRL